MFSLQELNLRLETCTQEMVFNADSPEQVPTRRGSVRSVPIATEENESVKKRRVDDKQVQARVRVAQLSDVLLNDELLATVVEFRPSTQIRKKN